MRRTLISLAVAAVLMAPAAGLAYPDGGCAAPQNWPPQTADIYLRTCGVSLSSALARHNAKPATAKHGSAAAPVAASVGGVAGLTGLAIVSRRRKASK
jgi:hypothetical protein